MMTGVRVSDGYDPARVAAYVEGCIQAVEEDPRAIRRAAADAQRISDFVLVRHVERETAREAQPIAATCAPGPQGPQRIQVPVPRMPVPQRSAEPSR